MVENEIVAEAFDRATFAAALTRSSYGDESNIATQVKYLARYCEQLGVRTVVREHHYVDRHFLDEYALYYSKNLDPPRSHVSRFHLFRSAITNEELTTTFEQAAATKDPGKLSRSLSHEYCGFVSIRPLPSTPVGRCVLRPLDDRDDRHILATGRYEVHLANLQLEVDGIAFQQQDVAVGACATAALWTALSRVTRVEGMRAPTPAEVSTAAARYTVPVGRTLPALSGLNVPQFCDAIRAAGFAPEFVRADLEPETFVAAIHTYLRSGIPVVLFLTHPKGDHAVAAVGFKLGDRDPDLEGTFPARSARMTGLYVHDDRLGPYARSAIRRHPPTDEFREVLVLEIDDDEPRNPDEDTVDQFVIDCAVVPVYPKLRLPARSLISLADLTARLVGEMVDLHATGTSLSLNAEFYYSRSGSYLTGLGGRIGSGSSPFLRRVALSRWCAIVCWFIDDTPLLEFVYDTTDILRNEYRLGAELLRAVVCLDPRFRREVADIAAALGALSV